MKMLKLPSENVLKLYYNFDRENDGKRQISATFVFDRAIVKLPEEEEA